jgi:hypothetical protein
MPKFFHIVYVHPVELGEPNLAKVVQEQEFGTRVEAEDWIEYVNLKYRYDNIRAVYHGCVNDETGELV